MSPLLLAALLTLHAPTARPTPLVPQSCVTLPLDRPPRDIPPARIAVMPRSGTRVLARHP